jgi:arylformamidase
MEEKMRIIDISLTITPQMPVWPGDPTVQLERVHKIEEGSNSNVSRLGLSVHTGTHVDAPVHFLPGAKSIETLPLDALVGPVQVILINKDSGPIQADDFEKAGIKPGVERLLIKSRNSNYWLDREQVFHTDFLAVGVNGAQYLVKKGIRLVGIDYLSISPFKQSRPTHEALLKAGIVILEGVDLLEVEPGDYMLYCLPLKLGGSDGAPARAILTAD